VLTATQIDAFFGVGLAGDAYAPQIWHLVRVHCSAGISRFAFRVWLGAARLVTTHDVATRAVVFILLGGLKIVATTVILLYGSKYASFYCRQPRSRRFRSRNEFVERFGRGCPRPSDLPLPRIVDFDEESGSFVYDERHHANQPDCACAEEARQHLARGAGVPVVSRSPC
jgi:hypothetical protein